MWGKKYLEYQTTNSFIVHSLHPAMLSCHACMRRCLQTLVGNSIFLSAPFKPSLAPYGRGVSRPFKLQAYSTSSESPIAVQQIESTKSVASKPSTISERKNRRQQWLESRGVRPKPKELQKHSDNNSARWRILKTLKDPLKLAAHVRKSLREEGFDPTLMMVRDASRDVQCTVSWNHLIDWQLSEGKMNAALKTFNEVLKYYLFLL